MGLLAVKLLITVCDKSLTKPECQKNANVLSYIRGQVASIEPHLIDLFETDAREFDQVVALRVARDRAKTTQERASLSRESNELLEKATNNAFAITELCLKLLDHGVVVFESGWHAVRGDSGAAISAAIAGVLSGVFIANLNIKTLKGRKYAADHIVRCSAIYQELKEKQSKAFACVTSLNSEALASIQLPLEVT